MNTPPITSASVRVMKSFDYSHFEIVLSTNSDTPLSALEVDALRKQAAHLADKAVAQYQISKDAMVKRLASKDEKQYLQREVKKILEKPEGDRSPNEMAKVKLLAEESYWRRREQDYDYQDDWEDDYEGEEA